VCACAGAAGSWRSFAPCWRREGRLTRPARIAFWFSAGRPVDAAHRPSERMSQSLVDQVVIGSAFWSDSNVFDRVVNSHHRARAVASTQITGWPNKGQIRRTMKP
jgi:hypothetical protein